MDVVAGIRWPMIHWMNSQLSVLFLSSCSVLWCFWCFQLYHFDSYKSFALATHFYSHLAPYFLLPHFIWRIRFLHLSFLPVCVKHNYACTYILNMLCFHFIAWKKTVHFLIITFIIYYLDVKNVVWTFVVPFAFFAFLLFVHFSYSLCLNSTSTPLNQFHTFLIAYINLFACAFLHFCKRFCFLLHIDH